MKKKSVLKTAVWLVMVLMLIGSVVMNVVLFQTAKQYYLDLNSARLDPLGLAYFQQERIDRDEEQPLVVFYGDSRAAQWPAPDVAGIQFINRGIGAQTSAQIVERYDEHIAPLQPDMLVVQLCINDLKTIPLFPEWQQQIIANCQRHIDTIIEQARQQNTTVILSTIFPVGEIPLERQFFWSDEVETAVNEVNRYIQSIDVEGVVIFDAFSILADKSGRLRQTYSMDELHLNEHGYTVLNKELSELISDE